jgi:hypothetical protein
MPIWAGGVSSSLSFCSQTYLFFAILFFIFMSLVCIGEQVGMCLIDYLDYRQHPSRDYATAYLDNCGRQVYKPPHPPPLYTLATGSQQYVPSRSAVPCNRAFILLSSGHSFGCLDQPCRTALPQMKLMLATLPHSPCVVSDALPLIHATSTFLSPHSLSLG